jgi:hypothetical protein
MSWFSTAAAPGLVSDKLLLRLSSSRMTRFQYQQPFSRLLIPNGLPNGNTVLPRPMAASRRCAAFPKYGSWAMLAAIRRP